MTTPKDLRPRGRNSVKTVRKRLADGTVKVYRYDPEEKRRREQAEAQRRPFSKIAEAYYASPEYKTLSPMWRHQSKYYIGMIVDELDWMTYTVLNGREARGRFYKFRDDMADEPAKADKAMSVLRRLLNFAYERGNLGVDANHALKIGKLVPSGRSRREHVWTEELEAALLAVASPATSRAFRGALYTGLRRSDLIGLRWGKHYDGRWIVVTPSKTLKKTSAEVHLPVYELPHLQGLIDELPRCSPFMFTTDAGNGWSPTNLYDKFREATARDETFADEDLTWHDIRGTTVTRLYVAGCSDAEVASITGHAIGGGSMLGNYAARTRELAVNAFRRWAAAMVAPQVIQFPDNRRQLGG